MGSLLDYTTSDIYYTIQRTLNLISLLLIIYLVILGLQLLGRLAKSLVLICGTCNHCCSRFRDSVLSFYRASKRGSAYITLFVSRVRDFADRVNFQPTNLSASVNFFEIIPEVDDLDSPV